MNRRSELIIASVNKMLEDQREALDAFTGLSQVAIIVNFDETRDTVRRIVLRPEFSQDARNAHAKSNGAARTDRGSPGAS